MDKQEIMARLEDHMTEALEYFPSDRIVGIFLQGSQNYGLDIEGSDIDTKLIVLPSLDDIVFNRAPVSTTHVRANDEHIDFKDIRLMFATFRKQNMNFVEILFTPYKIINPLYEDLWNELISQNELIAHYNEYRAVLTMGGIASEKYHALEHHYPSRMHMIDKFGYDPKQLHHLARICEFLGRYLAGESYKDCLKSNVPNYLKELKQGLVNGELLDLDTARDYANAYYDVINNTIKEYRETHESNPNPKVDELLDDIQSKIVRKSLIKELNHQL